MISSFLPHSPSSNLIKQGLGMEMNKVDWVLETGGKGGTMVNKKTHACPNMAGVVLLQEVVIIRDLRNNIVTSLDFKENSNFFFFKI